MYIYIYTYTYIVSTNLRDYPRNVRNSFADTNVEIPARKTPFPRPVKSNSVTKLIIFIIVEVSLILII